ncbi:MAG: hypothetical protein Q7T80_06510 [Methanoregula sp.]|nr:hypothetical protein [Methanoregula sp.]
MTLQTEIEILKDPSRIHEALYANSPRVLMFAFDNDPHVRSVINAGQKAVPLVAHELEKSSKDLNEITFSCYTYILEKIDAVAATKILQPLVPKIIDRPGFFIPTFVTHALRKGHRLAVKKSQHFYTAAELNATLQTIKVRKEG